MHVPFEFLTVAEAAGKYRLAKVTLRKYCRLPEDHPLHLHHIRTLNAQILLTDEELKDWFERAESNRRQQVRRRRTCNGRRRL